MPARPRWFGKLNHAIEVLAALPRPIVSRALIEELLGVGRRRAQQILSPCVADWIGGSGVADRDVVIAHLRRLAQGEDAYYETRRQRKVAAVVEELRRDRIARPRLLVTAPLEREFGALPSGVFVGPGKIEIEFASAQEALEKLAALAMAIGSDFDRFDRMVSPASPAVDPEVRPGHAGSPRR